MKLLAALKLKRLMDRYRELKALLGIVRGDSPPPPSGKKEARKTRKWEPDVLRPPADADASGLTEATSKVSGLSFFRNRCSPLM
jgi:hypothetical protein